ncbi:unnamed protein product [Medioppia subpectinata]|uniref:Major facilitator superfamily (MFS) profile domain-containing protein n=1 Tax=Medioppia subpectinata TaxID=1979941 RepID=A0A7R9KCY0_9ACAR|nr:unnamed protein product [Medioppia subpectinata]CAG2101200.1 unnamed protein product [Medioppia subpectinata]
MYQMGYVMNGLLLGYMSDRFGRRPTLWLAMIIEVCGGLSLIFSPTITMYIMSRFFIGLGDSGRGVSLYLLILETVGTKYRSDIVMTVTFGWITGYIALPGAACLLKDYQLLQAIPTTMTFVLMCTWLLTIPESPRHTGIGSCSIAARIGSILAPFVRETSEHYNFVISMMVFGLLALMATLLTLFLPETKDKDIPDNITDVEELRDLSGSNSANSDMITNTKFLNIIKETDNL